MSLAPRERETLAAIENQLRANAPRLEAMFRVFERDPRGRGRGLLWVSISLCVARRGPGNVIILLATIVTLLATWAVAIALLA
jgi:Protein of unknown function (DUF3040)